MAEKIKPLGICDHCDGPIKRDEWYTSKGKPRLYCSRECRNTGNSRIGNPVRVAKMMEHIKKGEWKNPAKLRPPTPAEQANRARNARLREVAQGKWSNPALAVSARHKLSRARKHLPLLHGVLEKFRQGVKILDLTNEEQKAYREYRRQLRLANREEVNRKARERYKKKHGKE